jgi:hypothetical protein
MIFLQISRPPPFDIFKGLALALLVSAAADVAKGQQAPRSARWYADHHDERFEMVARCNNHPGPSRRSDDCAAAWQGNIIAAEEEARRVLNDTTPPTRRRYWDLRPLERREHLTQCERMPEDWQARNFCGPAREAGKPGRRGAEPARRT